MTARDDVLHRVRMALVGARPAGPVPRDYRARGDLPPGDPALLDLLAERLVDYRAVVHRTDAAGLPAALAAAVTAAIDGVGGTDPVGTVAGGAGQAGRAAAGTGRPRLVVPAGLPREWLTAAAAEVVDDDELDAATLDSLAGVVTGCRVAVAETGTVVLDAGPDQGRRSLTLVPDLHLCVVRSEQVVGTVPEAVARLDPTRPLTWISGPSATSDIELVRVEGVHGPRRLHVVLVQDSPEGEGLPSPTRAGAR